MATTERDYYEVLGVDRGASEAEIKKAFRALARELHPDVSSTPDAERRFREVAEAFEVLSDPQRRSTYDRFGHAGLRTGGFQPFADFGSIADVFAAFFGEDLLGGGAQPGRTSRGGDVQAVVEVDLAEAFTGLAVTVPADVAAPCARCGATGAEPGTGSRTCTTSSLALLSAANSTAYSNAAASAVERSLGKTIVRNFMRHPSKDEAIAEPGGIRRAASRRPDLFRP